MAAITSLLVSLPGQIHIVKGIVSPDWKDLHMFSLDRFEV
jgi:hypothetical protein